MNSVIFSIPDVQAIQDGRKTSFRVPLREAHPQWQFLGLEENPALCGEDKNGEMIPVNVTGLYASFGAGSDTGVVDFPMIKLPYRPGDRLYVREVWQPVDPEYFSCVPSKWYYKTDETPESERARKEYLAHGYPYYWRSAATMPREAARLFLTVKAVRVERAQEITDEQAKAEGANWIDGKHVGFEEKMRRSAVDRFAENWNARRAKPRQVRRKGKITHYISHPWEDVQEMREYKGLPWYVHGNPWVEVVEFESEEKK